MNRCRTLLVILTLSWGLLALPLPPAGAAEGDVVVETSDYVVTSIPGEPRPLGNATSSLSLSDDVVTSAISLGFTTRFFGRATSEFWVGSNGFVTLHFLTPDGCCQGQPIPTPGGPDGMIAGFWTDLHPGAGGEVRFARQLVEGQPALLVDYHNVTVLGANGTASFQIVLLESGAFEIRIAQAQTGSQPATVGAESLNGSRGIQLFHGTGSLTDVGFRFEPVFTPSPPPSISFVTPSSGPAGTQGRILGSNFDPDARVRIGERSAPSFVENASSIVFVVPDLPAGPADVTVVNPDGNASTLTGGFFVTDSFALHGVSPTSLRQGDAFLVEGEGFGPNTVLLLDGTPLETTRSSSRFLTATVPATFRPGLHDVEVSDPARGVLRVGDALLVQGRPDLVLVSIDAQRPTVGAALAPVETPAAWNVTVTVANQGDATATGLTLAVFMTSGEGPLSAIGSAQERQTAFRASLAPGQTWTRSFSFGAPHDVGDQHFQAFVETSGAADRDSGNDGASTRSAAYLTGLGGGRLDPCAPVPEACMWPETRQNREEARDQVDNHTLAQLRIDATMKTPNFDFGNFPIVFTTTEEHEDGGFTDCITWRFLGGANGFLRVTMRQGNGLEGSALVENANQSTSQGSVTTREWRDYRAFGVILWEEDTAPEESRPSDPLREYVFGQGAEWSVTATGLTGDFTHCSIRTATQSRETFTFAALPADVQSNVPSFTGSGQAQQVRVEYEASTTESTPGPILGPLA